MHVHGKYSHRYDFALQMVSVFGWLCLIEAFIQRGWIYLILGLPLCGGLSWFFYQSPLKHFLYARLSLGARVSWEDADSLRPLFDADHKGKWFPMKQVKQMRREVRRDALLLAAQMVTERRLSELRRFQ
jgi:hypothetical protein